MPGCAKKKSSRLACRSVEHAPRPPASMLFFMVVILAVRKKSVSVAPRAPGGAKKVRFPCVLWPRRKLPKLNKGAGVNHRPAALVGRTFFFRTPRNRSPVDQGSTKGCSAVDQRSTTGRSAVDQTLTRADQTSSTSDTSGTSGLVRRTKIGNISHV